VTPLDSTTIQFGETPPFPFESTGTHGDWLNGDPAVTKRISFPHPFPSRLDDGTPSKGKIRVIVTPTFIGDALTASPGGGRAIVPIVSFADETGFEFNARNADPQKANTSFFWIAVLEGATASQFGLPLADVRFGILQSHHLGNTSDAGQPGDRDSCWTRWPSILFSSPLPNREAVVLTAHNLHIDADRGRQHNTATVGCVGGSAHLIGAAGGFGVQARSIDIDGQCGFYYVAAGELPTGASPSTTINVESGTDDDTDEDKGGAPVSASGHDGDWHYFDFYFTSQFLTPPVVVGTATAGPVVTIAQNVTTSGFTMATRNSDIIDSFSRFNWVAFGCDPGCG
jgi:hypothetical protein